MKKKANLLVNADTIAEIHNDVIHFIKTKVTKANICHFLHVISSDDNALCELKNETSFLPENSTVLLRVHYVMCDKHSIVTCKCGCGAIMDPCLSKIYASFDCYSKTPKSEDIKRRTSEGLKLYHAGLTEDQKNMRKAKVAKTNIERYGNKCSLNGKEQIEKKKRTWIEHYGVDNPNKSDIVREKSNKTNLEKYGNVCPVHDPKIQEKIQEHNLEKYGSKYVVSSQYMKEKREEAFITKYGVTHWMKVDANKKQVQENGFHTGYRYKILKTDTGKEYLCQGYEPKVIKMLLNEYSEDDIINDIVFLNSLNLFYEYKNSIHRYTPDIYIRSKDLVIEVKSEYYFKRDTEIIYLKAKSVIDSGHDFILYKSQDGKTFKKITYEYIKNYFEETCKGNDGCL